jgi:hypothetical protein
MPAITVDNPLVLPRVSRPEPGRTTTATPAGSGFIPADQLAPRNYSQGALS